MFNYNKKRELEKRELEIYKKEQLAEITLDIAKAQEKGAKDERDYECNWHGNREKLDTEIALLEAKKESYKSFLEEKMQCYIQEYQAVNKAKDNTIEILNETIQNLIKKMPVEITQNNTNK